MKKVFLTILVLLVVVAAIGITYLKFGLPNVGDAPDLKVDITPARVQHGEYLANHVSLCMDCHSTRDWSVYSAPLVPGTQGKGGEKFDEKLGFPGIFYSKNITPVGLKDWTDGEIFRTITTGENREGHALFPVMPYHYYGRMDNEDIYDIIAYVRSLSPIENSIPARSIDFPMNLIINTIPSKGAPVQKPSRSDTLKYGAYMVNASACMECHTQVNKGQIIPDLAFSGGREFKMPKGSVYSANITPDETSGIGSWSPEQFVARFKAYTNPANFPNMDSQVVNTVMPWVM
ncbi:MAG: cytochrome C, partial [Ginsengibacter sp.]